MDIFELNNEINTIQYYALLIFISIVLFVIIIISLVVYYCRIKEKPKDLNFVKLTDNPVATVHKQLI